MGSIGSFRWISWWAGSPAHGHTVMATRWELRRKRSSEAIWISPWRQQASLSIGISLSSDFCRNMCTLQDFRVREVLGFLGKILNCPMVPDKKAPPCDS